MTPPEADQTKQTQKDSAPLSDQTRVRRIEQCAREVTNIVLMADTATQSDQMVVTLLEELLTQALSHHRCGCGAALTVCASCAVADYQAAHTECTTCCPPHPATADARVRTGAEKDLTRVDRE